MKKINVLAMAILAMIILNAGSALAARTINSVTVNGGSSTTVLPGSSVTVVVSVTTDW